MRIELLDDTFEMENSIESVDELFNKINSILEDNRYAFDYMDIDGNQIYENHYDFFIDNLAGIKEVKVEIVSVAELIRGILISTVQYIEGAVPDISVLSDEFYRGPEQCTWVKLQQFIEGMEWVNSGAEVIINNIKSIGGLHEYMKASAEMKDKLAELAGAVDNSDMVLVGDLLSYEIIPMLERIKDTANEIVSREVDKDGSN